MWDGKEAVLGLWVVEIVGRGCCCLWRSYLQYVNHFVVRMGLRFNYGIILTIAVNVRGITNVNAISSTPSIARSC